jgi:hypothetical protein
MQALPTARLDLESRQLTDGCPSAAGAAPVLIFFAKRLFAQGMVILGISRGDV